MWHHMLIIMHVMWHRMTVTAHVMSSHKQHSMSCDITWLLQCVMWCITQLTMIKCINVELHSSPPPSPPTIGVLDFYFLLGPQPEAVVQQYQEVIGRPHLPPWALMPPKHCRMVEWLYHNSLQLALVVFSAINYHKCSTCTHGHHLLQLALVEFFL